MWVKLCVHLFREIYCALFRAFYYWAMIDGHTTSGVTKLNFQRRVNCKQISVQLLAGCQFFAFSPNFFLSLTSSIYTQLF